MANYQTLKAAINAVIKANGNKEITGTVLNEVLLAMVNSLGAGYQFAGVATPSTNPGTPDQKVFYIASQAGTYTNFGGAVVSDCIAIFEWNGIWTTETLDLPIPEQVQSDWTEDDPTKKSYIKHKPNIPPSANVDPVPTNGSPNAVSSGGTYNMIVSTAATLFGNIQDATNVNATLSEDGKIYNDYNAGDIFYIEQDDVRKYRVAYAAGTADAEHPVTINGTLFYYADNASDAIWLSLRIKTVSTEQQSLSAQQKAQARTNIAAVSYEQQSLNAGQQVQAQNNMMGKAYSSVAAEHSGLGKVYLDKNNGVLTQAMINTANTVYVIKYDYTLNGNTIALPSGCVLEFDGGHITGGTLTGTVLNESLNIDNFTLTDDATEALQNCVNICGTVVGSNKRYKVSRIINVNRALTLKGENLRLYSEAPLNFFNVNSDNVTISGVEIKGVAEGYPDKDFSTAHVSYLINIATGKKDITIKDCVLDSATGGVFVYPTCENITVSNCIMKNMVYIPNDVSDPFAGGAGGYGVCLHSTSNGVVTKNVKIYHNTFDNIQRHCAYVQVCKNVDFGYNQIVNSILSNARFTCAVHQAGCDNLLVHDNCMYGGSNFVGLANYDTVQIPKAITNVYNNTLFGITMFAVAAMDDTLQSLTIKGNYVELDNGCGFAYFGTSAKVEDVTISDNICSGDILTNTYYNRPNIGMVVFNSTKTVSGVIISNNKFNVGENSVEYCPCINVSYNKLVTSPVLKNIQIVNNQFTNKCQNGRGLLLGDLSVINSFFASNNIIDVTYQATEIQAVTITDNADVVIKSNYYKGAMTASGTVVDNIAIPS